MVRLFYVRVFAMIGKTYFSVGREHKNKDTLSGSTLPSTVKTTTGVLANKVLSSKSIFFLIPRICNIGWLIPIGFKFSKISLSEKFVSTLRNTPLHVIQFFGTYAINRFFSMNSFCSKNLLASL